MSSGGFAISKSIITKAVVKGLLSAVAIRMVFDVPLRAADYNEKIDYFIASAYQLLGFYDFLFLLIFIICGIFFAWAASREKSPVYKSPILSVFFSSCILIGNSYYEIGNWQYCFGSLVNFMKFAISMLGYSLLFHELISILYQGMDDIRRRRPNTADNLTKSKIITYFSNLSYRKVFLMIIAAWLPFILISYPGNLCWDVIGQIDQVIGVTDYSTHHPLVHTLFVGGMVRLGQAVFHSYEIGLFFYILLQAVLLAGALASTIHILAREKTSPYILMALLMIYCISPVYSNVVTTALKDVPFCVFVIWYVICFTECIRNPALLRNPKFILLFIFIQTGMLLLRNNGLYVVLLSGVILTLVLWKHSNWKTRIQNISTTFFISIMFSSGITLILMHILSASPGSSGELFSLPFQQTARYLQHYRTELTGSEREAIETILGDINIIAENYNPDLSDPVKALYLKDSSAGDLLRYFKTWAICFFKHPPVYVEAFFHHVYGWFDPTITNSIRYEAEYSAIKGGGLFPNASKVLIFYYRFAARITPLGLLENTGVYVWALLLLTNYQRKRREKLILTNIPLFISLLICMASPCFFNHPRYAFPIVFTLPFLYAAAYGAECKPEI